MKFYEVSNFTLTKAIPIVVSIIAVNQMFADGTPFTYLRYGTVIFHALTAIALCLAYFIGCVRLCFLPIPIRQIYSLSLVVTGIHFYDVLWGAGSVISGHGGLPWGPLISLSIASLLLVFLDHQNIFLRTTGLTWFFFTIMVVSICVMVLTGFYSRMALYDLGLGSDPNLDNYWWILSKVGGLLVMPLSTWEGEEAKDIRMSFT
jgi:hypothetical protein